MAKMYYTEAQACERLRVDPAKLMDMVRRGELHAYADGANKMFKVAEVDALAGPAAGPATPAPPAPGARGGDSDIQLAPVDSSGTHETISLADSTTSGSPAQDTRGPADSRAGSGSPAKSDTVITSEGISIFDDEDLEIETADPMAKTQIAPSLDEQIGGEAAGAGSGLLDLTRESDDTSLGKQVLDHIDMESGEAPAPSVASVAGSIPADTDAGAAVVETAAAVERLDPAASIYAGLAIGGTAVLLMLTIVAESVILRTRPVFVEFLGNNVLFVALGAVVVAVGGAVIGMVMGKKTAGPTATTGG